MLNKGIFIIYFLLFLNTSAQTPFVYWDSIPVEQWGDTIKYAFAGGFNNAQFSTIDLNGDGIEDLFAFERSTNKVYTFINTGDSGKVSYVYAPQYRKCFPPELTDWVLLRDYNCDGKKDIYTSRNASFAVYRNDYTSGGGLKFTLIKEFDQNIFYIVAADLPAITDVDGDGDMDLLTFDPAGVYLYFFKNLSIENNFHCDSLIYSVAEQCWGSFREAVFDCNLFLGDNTLSNCIQHNRMMPSQGSIQQENRFHPGNATLALDLNGDGKKELILGAQVCFNAIMLTNCDSAVSKIDSIVAQTNFYPDTPTAIDFALFPATYYEDVGNDVKKDLLAGPNRNGSEDTACAWYYKDTSTTGIPKFALQGKEFLQSDMIDVGEGSNPVFFDYNGDSLIDIVIGNYCYYSKAAWPVAGPAGLALYQNTGTKESPAFKMITRDYAGLSAYNLHGLYPAFGDLDGDGDEDMIVGEMTGHLYYFNNTAGKGNAANFVFNPGAFDSILYMIDVGQFATPQLVDLNCDGKLDLLVGNGLTSGNIKYYENTGTTTKPVFTKVTDKFGGIDVTTCCLEYAVPFFTTDASGNFQLLVGAAEGSIYSYTNPDNNINGTFQLSDAQYSGIREGLRTSICGADLDNDGKMDLVVGNYGGGITLFKGQEKRAPWNCPAPPLPFSVKIGPNPVSKSGTLIIFINGLSSSDNANLSMYNLLGQKIYDNQFAAVYNEWNFALPVSHFAAGFYFLKISIPSGADAGEQTFKLLITN